jgi:hypothetical protein
MIKNRIGKASEEFSRESDNILYEFQWIRNDYFLGGKSSKNQGKPY